MARSGPGDDPGDSGQQRKGPAGALTIHEVVVQLPKSQGKSRQTLVIPLKLYISGNSQKYRVQHK